MKKSLMITCLAIGTLGLMAIGLMGQPESKDGITNKSESVSETISTEGMEQAISTDDFALDVSTRFIATATKEDIEKATSISDIIPQDANWSNYSILSTSVRRDNFDLEKAAIGNDLKLNESQLALLKRVQYSDNLQFGARHSTSNESGSLNYMVTVVPEKQAAYIDGKDQLIYYLRENTSSMNTLLKDEQWRAGKINFIVDTQGEITQVNLTSSSGNVVLDQQMIRLISNTPGKWAPAENTKGEKVEQKLTLSFGSLGC